MTWTAQFATPPPRIEVLFHGDIVAELCRGKEGMYIFRYLPAFSSKKLLPLPGLPPGKEHASRDLFPFFKERIPELCRPEVLEWLKHQPVEKDDKLQLLGALGKRSVTDSYELRLTTAA